MVINTTDGLQLPALVQMYISACQEVNPLTHLMPVRNRDKGKHNKYCHTLKLEHCLYVNA